MNTDQQELAAYQRAVEAAKNEIAALKRRAERAEAAVAVLREEYAALLAELLAARAREGSE